MAHVQRPDTDPRNQQSWRNGLWIALAMAAGILLLGPALFEQGGKDISFSRFLDLTRAERIESATISEGGIEGTFSAEGEGEQQFSTTIPPHYEVNALVQRLSEQDVELHATRPSPWRDLLLMWGLPILLLVGGFFLVRRMMGRRLGGSGGPFGVGKAKVKLSDDTERASFDDVAALEDVRAEVTELVDYLQAPDRYERLGAEIPKGVLLVGPPGTGKTLLARAVAGEADVPFFFLSGSSFVEMFAGAGAARVRNLFEQAREKSPCIVFIDEIDAVGRARAGSGGPQMGAHQEREQTLQQLLNEMDGFEPNSGAIIMAATNRPDVLDQALLRPGRFDRRIRLHLPDVRGRRDILELHAKDVPLADDVDLDVFARRTPGFSGAQLANTVNEAALLAGRERSERVEAGHFETAVDRVTAGLERRSQVIPEDERRMIAYHEAGHALVAHHVEHGDPVHRISIVPRGMGALGFTQQLPEEDRHLISEPELRDRLAVLLGGRGAEHVALGYETSGAEDDLQRATDVARSMVTRFGMSEAVGPVHVGRDDGSPLSKAVGGPSDASDATEDVVDREVKALVSEAGGRAREILTEHQDDLDRLAEALLEHESVRRRDLEHILDGRDPD